MKRGSKFVYLAAALLLALSASLALKDRAAASEPTFIADNPKCTDLGYSYGFKIDPVVSGTYSIDAWHSVTITTSDNIYFDWTSTLSMDAVIVKGGPNANLYEYDPEAFGDTGLHAPTNPGGQVPALSHIEFCYDYELEVEKDAHTTFTRTYSWDIQKSVTPGSWYLFEGDTGTSLYTVDLTKDGYVDSDWAVSGTIWISNHTPFTSTITGIVDSVDGVGVLVDCGVTFPYDLPSGETLECIYSTGLSDGTTRTNTATVSTSGKVGGGQGSAAVVFVDPTTEVNGTIHVDDTNGGSWVFSDSGSVSYDMTFDCSTDSPFGNMATIRETLQHDDATVFVYCYSPIVRKTAETSYTRTYEWTIDKSADQSALTLSTGQTYLVNYSITVPKPTFSDGDWLVSGIITINNPAPIAATINDVNDYIDGTEADVDCGVTFPYDLAAGGTLTCSYSYAPGDADSLTNIADATLQNHDYSYTGSVVPTGETTFASSPVPVEFGDPTLLVDECIEVRDTNIGLIGTVCVGDTPWTYTYSLYVGPYASCGNTTFDNIASFLTNDTETPGSDSWSIAISVPCAGCTLTQGYWKTHSLFGPAPYDDTWAPYQSTVLSRVGLTWYQVLWTAPKGGDAYYILAHQYIAARLNAANGAYVPPTVQTAMNTAESLLNTYGPDIKGKGADAIRAAFLYQASILGSYNQGLIGPGHCTE